MAFTLGQAPDTLRVTLVGGADFVSSLRRKDGTPWPANSSLKLAFSPTTGSVVEWAATFANAVAIWDVDQVDVDALIALKPRVVRLWYSEGDLRLLWAQGDIDIRRS